MSPAGVALSISVAIRAGAVYAAGVLVDPSRGLVLTCAHVLEGVRTPILVLAPDGTVELAAVVARDGDLDAAFLAIPPRTQPPPVFGRAGALEAGASVAVVGSTRGSPFTPTRGVATGRSVRLLDEWLEEVAVPIQPGDSGGPVVDRAGRLLGIVGYVKSDAAGLGYLVRIEDVWARYPWLFPARLHAPASPASGNSPASDPASSPASTVPASSPASTPASPAPASKPASTPASFGPASVPESTSDAPASLQVGRGPESC